MADNLLGPAARSDHGLAGLGAVPHGDGPSTHVAELQDAKASLAGPQRHPPVGSRIGMPVGSAS